MKVDIITKNKTKKLIKEVINPYLKKLNSYLDKLNFRVMRLEEELKYRQHKQSTIKFDK
jgi:hypothetical protein